MKRDAVRSGRYLQPLEDKDRRFLRNVGKRLANDTASHSIQSSNITSASNLMTQLPHKNIAVSQCGQTERFQLYYMLIVLATNVLL
jgi:hypothetical protein